MKFVITFLILLVIAGCGSDDESAIQTSTLEPPVEVAYEPTPEHRGYRCIVDEVKKSRTLQQATDKCQNLMLAIYGPDIPDGAATDYPKGMAAAQECILAEGVKDC